MLVFSVTPIGAQDSTVDIDPVNYVDVVDNPYYPHIPEQG
jgi:hypothetical protein